MKNTIAILVCFCSILMFCFGCSGGSSETSEGIVGTFATGTSAYTCGTGSPAAFALNTNDVASLTVDITGDVAPYFKHLETHEWFANSIDCGSSSTCCVSAKFPRDDSYRITLFFNEKGTNLCPPPGTEQCYRWFRSETYVSGFVPTCTDVIYITEPNPDGFIGPCS